MSDIASGIGGDIDSGNGVILCVILGVIRGVRYEMLSGLI